MTPARVRVPVPKHELARVTRVMTARDPAIVESVFVFGSNLEGIHGKGAAKYAAAHYGAKRGVAVGRQGRAYAIPVKRTWREKGLPIAEIAGYVQQFLTYARARPLTRFAVTRVGCGEAGHSDEAMAALFVGAPANCSLPEVWLRWQAAVAAPTVERR